MRSSPEPHTAAESLAVALAERTGDRRLLAEAQTRVGLMRLNTAQLAESLRELRRALELFRELDDTAG